MGAELSELIRLILYCLGEKYGLNDGLYRDDGLCCFRGMNGL